MIHILLGGDTKNKNSYIKELTGERDSFLVPANLLDKELLWSYSSNISLFNESPVIIVENILKDGIIEITPEELSSLNESKTIFIFKEDKLTALEQKKYKKYADIKSFEDKKPTLAPKFNVFSITDSFALRDKINTWTLCNKGISTGIEPEAIAGVLFWKIKSMMLNGSRVFSKEELKSQSSNIVSLYHKAHRGETDFLVGLEQFILSSLSSKQ